jgi:ferritin-like metal-binding protein YciE
MRRALHSLKGLYLSQLQEVYSAEDKLVLVLPRLIQAAAHKDLKKVLAKHFKETKQHVIRLGQIFDALGEIPYLDACEPMEGLIEELEEIADRIADPNVKDAALIAAIQCVEHYEMALYGSTRTFAKHLGDGYKEQQRLLEQNLKEEGDSNKELIKIAEGNWLKIGVNAEAADEY